MKIEYKFSSEVNQFINKIDSSINNFRFNVSIAHIYEIYKLFRDNLDLKISNQVMNENLTKIMKLMIPFTPHLAYECLELLKCKTTDNWPKIDKKNILNEIKMAIQVNGKTRDVILIPKDLVEKEINEIILKKSKVKKYLEQKKILKTIFVKNKILNYIITS